MISLILLKLFTFSQILQGVHKLSHATVSQIIKVMTHGTNLYSNNDVFTGDELKSYCHRNTAVAIHHVSDWNLIMDEKETLRLPLPECTERMRKTMLTPPEPHNLEARVGEHVRDNLAVAVSAPKYSCACFPWARLPVKDLNQVKHFTCHVVSIPFLAKFHFICLELHVNFWYSVITFVVCWTGKQKVAGLIAAPITTSVSFSKPLYSRLLQGDWGSL